MSEEILNTEQTNPDRDVSADWVGKLRYSKSFTAKLLLSDQTVKEYYSEIATELLSYDKVRSHTGWTGVSFIVGRTVIARCSISGKTLCLYLSADPETVSGPRYKARDVSDIRKYEKTPALLRIRSNGAAKNAVQCIGEVAVREGLAKKDPPPEPILPRLFPAESFHNLVTRGLIRFVRDGGHHGETVGSAENENHSASSGDAIVSQQDVSGIGMYTDTVNAARDVISRHAEYGKIAGALASGDASVKVSEKKMLRALDESWVRTVEDALPAIDELMRRPSHFIAETEEVLPMELTRKITGRSVVHLSQHTDFISSVDGDEVTPSKLLNVFREDSVLTYENKFLNTLLAHLYFFVNKRYRIALESGVDERVDCVQFEDSFFHDEAHGKIRLTIELSEKLEDSSGVKKSFLGTPLWARVEKLNEIVKSYMDSNFVREMGHNYVNPPILHTNAILKNKYFRQCLDLWNFLQSYDESGLGITVCETVRDPDDDYIREIYDNAAAQYMLFRHHTRGEYGEDSVLAAYTSEELRPHINVKVRDAEDAVSAEDFNVDDPTVPAKSDSMESDAPDPFVSTPEKRDILFAVRVAMKAAEFYDGQNAPETEDYSYELDLRGVRYEKTFDAKLRLADDRVKQYYVGLANALLSYRRVKLRPSRMGCAFTLGRTRLALITFKGKTMYLYAALDPKSLPSSYYVRDVSGVKRYSSTPSQLRVRSDRWMKYALSMISRLAEKFELEPTDAPETVFTVEDFPMMTYDELLEHDWIRRVTVKARPDTDDTEEDATDETQADETVSDTADISAGIDNIDEAADADDADDDDEADDDETEIAEEISEDDEPDDISVEYDSSAIVPEVSKTINNTPIGGVSYVDDDDADYELSVDDVPDFDLMTAAQDKHESSERTAEHTAQYFENSSANPDNYSYDDKPADENISAKNERFMSDIRYPGAMDYSRPTQHGVDDSSGFIKDIEENSPNNVVTADDIGEFEEKRGVLGRMLAGFGKNKKNKNKRKK